jgi:F-type H+-transporting ATPase subunit b
MEELITTFHIDWKLMIAQIVNFGLVFAALYLIAAKPLSKLIKDRDEEITTGLENAKKAETEVARANITKEEIIKTAKEDAKKVLISSQADGKEIIKEAKDKAVLEKEEIIRQAKLDAEKAKKGADDAVRAEAAGLVTEGVKKIIESHVAAGKGEDLIKAMLQK